MTMNEQIIAHPEWTTRTHVEAWLTRCARDSGEYAEIMLAEFGARLDGDEASVVHLTEKEVSAIMAAACA